MNALGTYGFLVLGILHLYNGFNSIEWIYKDGNETNLFNSCLVIVSALLLLSTGVLNLKNNPKGRMLGMVTAIFCAIEYLYLLGDLVHMGLPLVGNFFYIYAVNGLIAIFFFVMFKYYYSKSKVEDC